MYGLNWMLTIIDRRSSEKFIRFYRENSIRVSFVAVGHGTASSEVLDILGFDSLEKVVIFSLVTAEVWPEVLKKLRSQMRIDVPGMGIVVLIPVSTVGGGRQLAFLTGGQSLKKEEVSVLRETKYELLTVIAEQGYSDLVMDAARGAGAGGGTVIHARGTGIEKAEKLLGVSIAREKELILVVVRTAVRNTVMEAVMREAGLHTEAKAIVFSLPVSATAGMRLMEEDFAE